MLDIFDILAVGTIVDSMRDHEWIVTWNKACTLTLWHADLVSGNAYSFDEIDVRTMAVDGERATLDYAEQRARVWLDELRKENGES
jgi:hypothetical protein